MCEASSSSEVVVVVSSSEQRQANTSTTTTTTATTTSDNDDSNNRRGTSKIKSCSWESIVNAYINTPIRICLLWFARTAAIHPGKTIVGTILLSFTLVTIGFYTNFHIETNGDVLWTPTNSKPQQHGKWVNNESGFPKPLREILFILHANGNNVINIETLHCLFDVIETIQNTTGYKETCKQTWGVDECPIQTAANYFNNNRTMFINTITSVDDLRIAMSYPEFPNGEVAIRDLLFGYANPTIPSNNITSLILDYENFNPTDYIIQSAQSYIGKVSLSPEYDIANQYEFDITDALYDLNDIWDNNNNNKCYIEVNTRRSLDDEMKRSITNDIPYMISAFIVMGIFCALYLSKLNNLIHSQSILGLGAVITIILSICTGYGILFICNVPFTSVTQIFIYIMCGIGLDDTFIITGSFTRQDKRIDVVTRIENVINEVGVSIFVSTLTTVIAFALGSRSTLPGVRWFSYYAAPTVFIDFIYQITFFIAILIYDDKRIQSNRYDCCVCIKKPDNDKQEKSTNDIETTPEQTPKNNSNNDSNDDNNNNISFTEKMMTRYANFLLKPITKIIVIIIFIIMLGLGIYGATLQRQEMDFRDLTPTDSYVRTYFDALYTYSTTKSSPYFQIYSYFRNVDFSSKQIQEQMNNYITDIVNLPSVSEPPMFFWINDLNDFILNSNNETLNTLSFNEQVDIFLNTSPYNELYENEIVRDDNNNVIASRCSILFDQSSIYDVEEQINTLQLQRKVTKSQPINDGKDEWSFFLFTGVFYVWELFDVIFNELIYTVILGIVGVCIVSIIFIPNIIGVLLLTPIVTAIYIELMAFLYIANIYINGPSAICLIMSIGLVVDYNFHIVLTYFEILNNNNTTTTKITNRDEHVTKVLTTMGTSILTGGFTTFLGVLPLSLTSSLIFRTFFYSFLAIPTLGIAHGLILVPVLLSLIGPTTHNNNNKDSDNKNNDDSIVVDYENNNKLNTSINDDSAGMIGTSVGASSLSIDDEESSGTKHNNSNNNNDDNSADDALKTVTTGTSVEAEPCLFDDSGEIIRFTI